MAGLLPIPGVTNGTWGTMLDTYLSTYGSAGADLGEQTGVDPTGSTECAAAINTALAAIAAVGGRAYARGTFKIASTVTITSDADLGDALFNWAGSTSGVAVQLGDGSSGVLLHRKRIVCPKVINTNKTGTGWTGSAVGVRVVNAQRCRIEVPYVKGFVKNLYIYGLGQGSSYNQVFVGHLETGKTNLALGAGAGGWSNQNNYYLGSLFHDSAEGTNVSGVRQIQCETAGSVVNGNIFIGGSVEGDTAEFHLDCDGQNNRFLEVRWEVTGGARVKWGANSSRNLIDGGYGAEQIVETWVAGGILNRLVCTGTSYMVGGSAKAVQVLENQTSADYAVDAVMAPGARASGADPATAYRVYRTANNTHMKQAADAFPRLTLDHDNGRLKLGFGTAAPAIVVQAGSGSPNGVVTGSPGSLYLNASGGAGASLYVKESGVGTNTGWVAK